ncbi:hypothetical protein AM1_E0182 (plasmid) [Acaryochloris marina MBIC11017]|uniref:Uncharacterized protein n=1 Tax=Acaryochloris marina (strain MBIC 11017) TaxID=329726 RepID=A8ZPL5_ACAM1|nr:hypothetical protein AM1_E0182 [Acaryochloris marina MBIC11017]
MIKVKSVPLIYRILAIVSIQIIALAASSYQSNQPYIPKRGYFRFGEIVRLVWLVLIKIGSKCLKRLLQPFSAKTD